MKMKRSSVSFVALNRRAILLAGFVMSIAVFGIIVSQIDASSDQDQESKVITGQSYKNDVSILLRDMDINQYVGKPMDREASENPKVPHVHIDVPDEAVQDQDASDHGDLDRDSRSAHTRSGDYPLAVS